MKKIILIALTYLVCRILKIGNIWLGFMSAFVIIHSFKAPLSAFWEIPIGCLLCAIALETAEGDMHSFLSVLIPTGAVLTAFSSPGKLAVFFPLAVAAIVSEKVFFAAALFSVLWCSVRNLFVKNYFTTKKAVLQADTD